MITLEQTDFGSFAGGQTARLFRLKNAGGIELALTDLGAVITELHVPDSRGRSGDIVLGYDSPEAYYRAAAHMGAIAGRFAGRIAGGTCAVEGKQISLSQNHGRHHLHGGFCGFNKKLWQADADKDGVSFHLVSPDGDEGYPGELEVTVRYSLHEDNSLQVTCRATSGKTTIINLTQHSYFNLSGDAASAIDAHMLTLPAAQILDCDADNIPTGTFLDVAGTPFDFRAARTLARDYDHTCILPPRQAETLGLAARLSHPPSGRIMEILTDQPAVQLYTAQHLTGDIAGKGGIHYGPRQAVCLESQNFPDAPHHPHFPSAVLEAGDVFFSRTIFRFGGTYQQ